MFIEKVPINYLHGKAWQIWLFGKAIVQVQKKQGKTKITFFPFRIFYNMERQNSLMFYLKFNSTNDGFSLWCLHHWINIVMSIHGGGYYIVCDKPVLIKKILISVPFDDCEVKIIPSSKYVISKKQLTNICHPIWKNACLAHLTTFSHAIKHGIKEFWNIDADDTSYFLPPDRVAQCLEDVRQYAKQNAIAVMSQDMHRSRLAGQHWSFGITYVNNVLDYKDFLKDSYDSTWNAKWKYIFEKRASMSNLDWYFTYLHDIHKLKIETFTINNVYFMHWGIANTNSLYTMLQISRNGRIAYPLFSEIFNADSETEIEIFDDVIEFNSDSETQESAMFLKAILLARQKFVNSVLKASR